MEQTKYNAKKVIVTKNGRIIPLEKGMTISPGDEKFDSKVEALFYLHLLDLKLDGLIASFTRQPKFILQDKFTKRGKNYLPIAYVADFEVHYSDGRKIIYDVKGMEDAQFKIKKKMFEFRYPDLELVLMKYVKKFGGWISSEEWKRLKAEEEKVKKNA